MTNKKPEDKEIINFIQSAIDFCSVVDNEKNLDTIEFLQKVYLTLIKLIQSSSKLPIIRDSNNFDKEPSKSWREIYDSLRIKLEQYDLYSEIFDPFEDKEPVQGTLTDDISDIYCDIKSGLENWENSDSMIRNDIVWDWQFGFEKHWGEHATGAIRALYFLLFRKIHGDDGLPIGLRKLDLMQ